MSPACEEEKYVEFADPFAYYFMKLPMKLNECLAIQFGRFVPPRNLAMQKTRGEAIFGCLPRDSASKSCERKRTATAHAKS